ncbi:MAG: hypothetical protein KDK70_22965 [Myxococcales bacterium]|nr:hypothetical protein [Myxococcales bacterium]
MELLTSAWGFIVILTILVLAVAAIWLIAQAFAEHFLWGLAVLFIPMAYVVFAALNWKKSGRPFLLGLAATGALVVEVLITGGVTKLFGG